MDIVCNGAPLGVTHLGQIMHLVGFQATRVWTGIFSCFALLFKLFAQTVAAVVNLVFVNSACG